MNRLSQLLQSIDQSGGCRSTASLMQPFHLTARGRNEGIRLTTEFKPSYYMKLVVSLTTTSSQICAAPVTGRRGPRQIPTARITNAGWRATRPTAGGTSAGRLMRWRQKVPLYFENVQSQSTTCGKNIYIYI